MSTVQTRASSDRRARAFRQRQRRRAQRPHQTLLDLVFPGLELGGNLLAAAPYARCRAYFAFERAIGVANLDALSRRSRVVHAHADARSDETSAVELRIALVDDRALTLREYAERVASDAGARLLRRIQNRCAAAPSPSSPPLFSQQSSIDAAAAATGDPNDAKRSRRAATEKENDDAAKTRNEKETDGDDDERDGRDWMVDFFEWAARRYASLAVDSRVRTEFLPLASAGRRDLGATQRSFTALVSVADAQLLLADLVVRRQLMASPTTAVTAPSGCSPSPSSVATTPPAADWRRGRAGNGPTCFHVHLSVPAHDSEPWREWSWAYSVDSRGRPLRRTWFAQTGAASGGDGDTHDTSTDDDGDDGDDTERRADDGDGSDSESDSGNRVCEYGRTQDPATTTTATTAHESKEERVDRVPVRPELPPLQKPQTSRPENGGRRSGLAGRGERRPPVLEIRGELWWTAVSRAQRRCLRGLAAAASTATVRSADRPAVSFRLPASLAHLAAQLAAECNARMRR